MSQLGCSGNKLQEQKRAPGASERERPRELPGGGDSAASQRESTKNHLSLFLWFFFFLVTSPFLFLSLLFCFYLFILPGMY